MLTSPPDLAALPFEIDDASRAMQHGRADADPIRESERLAAAWRALDTFARSAFPEAKE